MNWPRLFCKPFCISVWCVKGMVAFTLKWGNLSIILTYQPKYPFKTMKEFPYYTVKLHSYIWPICFQINENGFLLPVAFLLPHHVGFWEGISPEIQPFLNSGHSIQQARQSGNHTWFLQLNLTNRGRQPFSRGYYLVSTLILCNVRLTITHLIICMMKMHHAILQSRISTVIIATAIWAAILWLLWHHTDGLYCIRLALTSYVFLYNIQEVSLLWGQSGVWLVNLDTV